jgi:hypothetical protein
MGQKIRVYHKKLYEKYWKLSIFFILMMKNIRYVQ